MPLQQAAPRQRALDARGALAQHHAGALPEALGEFARNRIDLLVVNGGDGTLQHALTEILGGDDFEQIPMIAPLRGGRTNMTALDLGAVTIANKATYGTFTVYVVTGGDVEAQVTGLLADAHTGALGTPAAGNIYWESGTTIYGDRFALAKRRYGANVVLWWIGSKPVKKTDATFRRLHKALTKVTAS